MLKLCGWNIAVENGTISGTSARLGLHVAKTVVADDPLAHWDKVQDYAAITSVNRQQLPVLKYIAKLHLVSSQGLLRIRRSGTGAPPPFCEILVGGSRYVSATMWELPVWSDPIEGSGLAIKSHMVGEVGAD